MGTGEFNAGGNPAMEASHPGGSRNTPSRFMLQKPEISAGLMGLLGLFGGFLMFQYLVNIQSQFRSLKSTFRDRVKCDHRIVVYI